MDTIQDFTAALAVATGLILAGTHHRRRQQSSQRMPSGSLGTADQEEMGYAVFFETEAQIVFDPLIAQQQFKTHILPSPC
jgi:hypothetical protein